MKARDYLYYTIIAVASLVMVCVLPMFGSDVGLGFNLPNTKAGWVLYCVTKGSAAVCNVTIFHCFVRQGVYNVRDNERYKEACAILDKMAAETTPRAPGRFYAHAYGFKGLGVFVFSVASVIGLTSALLTYDVIAAVSYMLTVVMGIVFGVMQMRSTEEYFTTEFWRYAKLKESEEKENGIQCGRQDLPKP